MSIRHNCETGGCYVKMHTPDWGFLDHSFSGKISVSDIDGAVEANGYLLLFEWKGENKKEVPTGQEIMFKKITKNGQIVVFVIFGDSLETTPKRIVIYHEGEVSLDKPCDRDYLKRLCENWEAKARSKGGFKSREIQKTDNVHRLPIAEGGA